ncbi:MAG TPA: DUF445 family protein [Sphingobacteriaceae bacterium]|nr:DUF445 family protein [Sphingobacteriaceae bacterium]
MPDLPGTPQFSLTKTLFWLLYPGAGALIGWLTNWMAIRLLFRPHKPVGIGPWRLQGLLPRRRRDLALTVAQVVERELLSSQDLMERLAGAAARTRLVDALAAGLAAAVEQRLPLPLPGPLTGWLHKAARSEAQRFVDRQLPGLLRHWLADLQVASLIQERLDSLDIDEMEQLVHRLARQELRYIELMGALVGGLVGMVQALLVHYI